MHSYLWGVTVRVGTYGLISLFGLLYALMTETINLAIVLHTLHEPFWMLLAAFR